MWMRAKRRWRSSSCITRHRIRTRGRVDDGDTVLDTDAVERQRGSLCFSDIACFPYRESLFIWWIRRGILTLPRRWSGCCRFWIMRCWSSAAWRGVQGHTETVWELLREYRVPVFFFINKTDRVGADPQGVLRTLKSRFSPDIIDFETEYTEKVAELREDLLALYLEDPGRRSPGAKQPSGPSGSGSCFCASAAPH